MSGEVECIVAGAKGQGDDDEKGRAFDARWMQQTKNLGYFRPRSAIVGCKIYTKIQMHDEYQLALCILTERAVRDKFPTLFDVDWRYIRATVAP